MVTLKELLELTWTVTRLSLNVRDPEHGHLVMAYVIGEGCNEEAATIHQRHRMAKGELTMIDKKINYYGDNGKKGEGWGTNFNNVPADLLAMEITFFRQTSRGGWRGSELTADLVPADQLKMKL